MTARPRGLPAHAPGPSFLSYSPNGNKLISVGSDNNIRIYQTGSNDEPVTITAVAESSTSVAAHDKFFIVGSDDGRVARYSIEKKELEDVVLRVNGPVVDVALSPDGQWLAAVGEDLVIKILNLQDTHSLLALREQPDSIKHLSFDQSGTILAASCKNGTVYIYSLSSQEPRLIKAVAGLIKPLDAQDEASSKIFWHPTSSAFGAATNTRDFQVMARDDWSMQKTFKDGHTSDITAAAWSSNGALLVTTDKTRKFVLWETKTQTIIRRYDHVHNAILAMQWHPKLNILAYTDNDGTLYIHSEFLSKDHQSYLSKPLQKPPFIQDRVQPSSPVHSPLRPRRDSLDELLSIDGGNASDQGDADADEFVVDNDGAGYAEAPNVNGKRPSAAHANPYSSSKRNRPGGTFSPYVHESFQPGSTSWRGNRRYLCLSLIGVVWTTNQDTHHSVTVEFYDRDFQRDFHFTDMFKYNKACLAHHGTLFACDARGADSAQIYYRPHETWTTRTDWRTALPTGENITAIALSDSCCVVSTSTGYVRVYSLFGLPLRIYRQKAWPAVTCAAWQNYILTIGNGPVGADGRTSLLYSIENVARDTTLQSNDIVALGDSETTLTNVFFSDVGDPCIYDSTSTLLVLQGWREQGQAKWIPLLDVRSLNREGMAETLWPVAVADGKFHCFILKGDDTEPYFPRPLLTDFPFTMPLSTPASGGPAASLEHTYLLTTVLASLLRGTLSQSSEQTQQPQQRLEEQHAKLAAETDKALLQLLGEECKLGEERGMRALEICGLMPNGNGRMLDLARKVALRFGRESLAQRIDRLEEKRLRELADGDGGGGAMDLDR